MHTAFLFFFFPFFDTLLNQSNSEIPTARASLPGATQVEMSNATQQWLLGIEPTSVLKLEPIKPTSTTPK